MPKKRFCPKPGCPHPELRSNDKSGDKHGKRYHQNKVIITFNDIKQDILRDELTSKFPCPCGSPVHARYDSSKLHHLCRRRPHPSPEANEFPDSDSDSNNPITPAVHKNAPIPQQINPSSLLVNANSYPLNCPVDGCCFQSNLPFVMQLHERVLHAATLTVAADGKSSGRIGMQKTPCQPVTRVLRSSNTKEDRDEGPSSEDEDHPESINSDAEKSSADNEDHQDTGDCFITDNHVIQPVPILLDGPLDGTDLAYVLEFQAIFCLSCQIGVKTIEIRGHLRRHKGLKVDTQRWDAIWERISKLRIVDDRSAFKFPPGRLPLLDFIRIPEPEDPSDPPGLGYYCTVAGCRAAALRLKTMRNHIYVTHRDRGHRSHAQCWERGYVQQLFSNASGKQYIRVDPHLKAVASGSTFDRWYRTLHEPGTSQKTATLPDICHPGNIDTFLKKAGWVTQIRGYSAARFMRLVSIPSLRDVSDPLHMIKDIAVTYLRSIMPNDLAMVHPSQLHKLNHWKKYQPAFTLLTTEGAERAYAHILGKLCLLVLRVAQRQDVSLESCNAKGEAEGCRFLLEDFTEEAEELEEDIADALLSVKSFGAMDKDQETEDGYDEYCDDWDEDDSDLEADDSLDIDKHLQGGTEYPILLSSEQNYAASKLLATLECHDSLQASLSAFHELVLSIFTTQIEKAETQRFHTIVDATLMALNLRRDGSFRPTVDITPDFSKLQYFVLFSILKQALLQQGIREVSETLLDLQEWYRPDVISPFATIRYYQKLGWSAVKMMVGRPRLLWYSRDGPDFQMDGVRSSVLDWTGMIRELLQRAEKILQDDLLLGLADNALGVSPDLDLSDKIDDLRSTLLGYGFLGNTADHEDRLIVVMKNLMELPAFLAYFSDDGKNVDFHRESCHRWLLSAKEFKEIIYVIIHIAAGLPKRATEEALFKLVNIPGRARNLVCMLEELFIIGDYSKTTAITGADKLTLHMIPRVVSRLLVRFFRCAAPLEQYFVSLHYPERSQDNHAYLYSSMGERWAVNRFSKILAHMTKQYLGTRFNISQIRHIMPGIVEHYRLDITESNSNSLRHIVAAQSGHTPRMLDQRYSILHHTHPQLTNRLVHDTIDFSKLYHKFWGVVDDPLVDVTAEDLLTAVSGELPPANRLQKVDRLLTALEALVTAVSNTPAVPGTAVLVHAQTSSPSQSLACEQPVPLSPSPSPSAQKFLDESLHVMADPASSPSLISRLDQGLCPECDSLDKPLPLDSLREHVKSHPKSAVIKIREGKSIIRGLMFRSRDNLKFHCACGQEFESKQSATNHIDSLTEAALVYHRQWPSAPAWRL